MALEPKFSNSKTEHVTTLICAALWSWGPHTPVAGLKTRRRRAPRSSLRDHERSESQILCFRARSLWKTKGASEVSVPGNLRRKQRQKCFYLEKAAATLTAFCLVSFAGWQAHRPGPERPPCPSFRRGALWWDNQPEGSSCSLLSELLQFSETRGLVAEVRVIEHHVNRLHLRQEPDTLPVSLLACS